VNIITLDFETYFDDDYTLSKLTTEAYIRDKRFEAHGVGLRVEDQDPIWLAKPLRSSLAGFCDWKDTAVLCHHAAFDGLILSRHYGVMPGHWLCTYSMAQFLFGPEQSKSLGALAQRFGLSPKTVPYDKIKGKLYEDMGNDERRELADGCLHDCALTFSIFSRMMAGDY
jgi:DNA polymerase III epsilon subunit-like protein